MEIKLNQTGFDETISRLKNAGVFVGSKATMLAIADLASSARKKADKALVGKLEMGKPQKKGNRAEQIYSRYDASSGSWVSANYRTTKGPWKLSRFTWETARATRRNGAIKVSAYARARYTSTIANLWENPTKPYAANSPVVGSEGRTMVIPKGAVRRGLKYWNEIESIFIGTIPESLAKTEAKMIEEFRHGNH